MRDAQEAYVLDNVPPARLDTRPSTHRFSTCPLYLQVRNAIAQRIMAGEWKPRTAIPSESELAREFNVSVGTMRKALDVAEAERLLTRRQGRGTFVNDHSSSEHAARYSNIRSREGNHISGDVTILNVLETTVNEREGMRLRLRARERVHRIRRVWSIQGIPYMLEDVAMPAKLFPRFATHEDASLHLATLAQQVGILLGRYDERISISGAAPDVATALHVEAGAALMRLDRVIYTLQDVPVEWRLGQCLMEDSRYYLAQFK
jgi:GntR family transcriptional regulator